MTKRTDIPKCPYCKAREAWLAANVWTCRKCAHSWQARQGRKLKAQS